MATEASDRTMRIVRSMLIYSAIITATLVILDIALVSLGLFAPRLDYGDDELGWRPAAATGDLAVGRCLEVATGRTIDYPRNEDGVRTHLRRSELIADTSSLKIAVVGDSHTELCAPNEELHSGVLERELRMVDVPAVALPYGAGKYSPLQAYLAYRTVLRPYRPSVLVVNLYTGNDFYDILRVDDRPHMVASGSGYEIAPPIWYSRDDPSVTYNSRVLFAIRSIAERVGIRRIYLRVAELRRVAAQQGAGMTTVVAYMRDLWRAREPTVGYPDAFTSQMLNQQLFFHHFPDTKLESLRRIEALMELIRAQNPEVLLVMSPIPSYELTAEQPVDSAFLRTLDRIPITLGQGIDEEQQLYEALRRMSYEAGWLFIDNLAALRAYDGGDRLYNNVDYHLSPEASQIIGTAQARALRDTLAIDPPASGRARHAW